jgi:hypothetical protein
MFFSTLKDHCKKAWINNIFTYPKDILNKRKSTKLQKLITYKQQETQHECQLQTENVDVMH